ncbi:MAG: hypothetical protein ACSHYB_14120 [Roseibacillus sp.]
MKRLLLCLLSIPLFGQEPEALLEQAQEESSYRWTMDHMHVGVRWQPFAGRPENNQFDSTRAVIAEDSSYVQFWIGWEAIERNPENCDYLNSPSSSLVAIDRAVDACQREGLKVEFVFFGSPAWATEKGESRYAPRVGVFPEFCTRIATHFKGRVDAYQLAHEANLEGLVKEGDIHFRINELLLNGAKAIRKVYDTEPALPVILSTTGMSPCRKCPTAGGLEGVGAVAIDQFYDFMIATPELMETVDALNLNVSDQNDGYGGMDGALIPSVWGNYEMARRKLDAVGLHHKAVLSAESWISWDGSRVANDVNGDGLKNELDAYEKSITIIGQCLQRGLNTINLPWSDNSSSWAMGLTKRLDYNGRIKELKPEIVIPANDGGPDVVTEKLQLGGTDKNFVLRELDERNPNFTIENYTNPADPNHLHYYVWRWYAQIAGGKDEVVRHAIAGERGNDIAVIGAGFTGSERYRVSSWNRTQKKFTVLLYGSGASGLERAELTIPATIQTGRHYHTGKSPVDFRGEGFPDGAQVVARVVTKELSPKDGSDQNVQEFEVGPVTVKGGKILLSIPKLDKFTLVEVSAVSESE